MRGIGRTLSRLPTVRALLAGAVVLVTMVAPKAYGQSTPNANDMALAIPRVAPRGGGAGIGLPHLLAPSDASRLRRIFARQGRGDLPGALKDIAALDGDDPVIAGILGHLAADRLLGPYTRATVPQLKAWLDRWPGLPDAPAIHALLTIRLPKGAPVPPEPELDSLDQPAESKRAVPVPEETDPPGKTLARHPAIDQQVRKAARSGVYGAASKAILAQRGLPPGYAAMLRGETAQILFASNRDREAYEVAAVGAQSCQRPHRAPPASRSPPPDTGRGWRPGGWAGLRKRAPCSSLRGMPRSARPPSTQPPRSGPHAPICACATRRATTAGWTRPPRRSALSTA